MIAQTLCAASLIASVSAFVAPSSVLPSTVLRSTVRSVTPSSGLKMSAGTDYVDTLPGKPFGDGKVFDPLNLADGADPDRIKQWREAELKHGRVAMLASLGVLVAEQFHPLFLMGKFVGPATEHFQEISARYPLFWFFSLLGVAFIEYKAIDKAFAEPDAQTGEGRLKPDYTPGDLGFDPLGLKPDNEADLETIKTKELNNGRLAMIGIAGMLVQELVKPSPILG